MELRTFSKPIKEHDEIEVVIFTYFLSVNIAEIQALHFARVLMNREGFSHKHSWFPACAHWLAPKLPHHDSRSAEPTHANMPMDIVMPTPAWSLLVGFGDILLHNKVHQAAFIIRRVMIYETRHCDKY